MTNRDQLQNLKHALRWTDQQIADYLAETTMRPCSVHAVRGWLAHPDRLYARRCPDWAVMLLSVRPVIVGAENHPAPRNPSSR